MLGSTRLGYTPIRGDKKRVRHDKSNMTSTNCWKKKSIFFELEYWKYLHVRHNLDVMHIEKNVCKNIIGTLLKNER